MTGAEAGGQRWPRGRLRADLAARPVLAAAALVALLAIAGVLVTRPIGPGSAATGAGFYAAGAPQEGIGVGERAPELMATVGGAQVRAEALDGSPVAMGAASGRGTWLVFGASWCPPCREEAPVIRALHAEHADRVALVMVAVQETASAARAFGDEFDLRQAMAVDRTGAVAGRFGVFGYPTHYFVDAEGIVRDRYFGPLSAGEMERRLALIIRP